MYFNISPLKKKSSSADAIPATVKSGKKKQIKKMRLVDVVNKVSK